MRSGILGLALGQDAARAKRVRGRPGAGGVDHRPRQVAPDRAVAVRDGEHERLGLAALAEHLVGALPGDGRHLRAGLDHRRHLRRRGERLEVGLVQVRSRRHGLAGRLLPAMGLEQRAGRRVGVVLPRREQADMAPIADVGADGLAGLVDLHGKAAPDQVGGGGQADGACADDGNGEGFERGHGKLLGQDRQQGTGSGARALRRRVNELGPAMCRLGAASGQEPLHRDGMEVGPPQADVAQEVIVEIGQGQHLAVRGGGAFPA